MKRFAWLLVAMVAPAMAGDSWIRVTTPHFELYTTADQKKARDTILYFERVREFFMKASPVKPPGEFPTRIIAFKDAQQFRAYAPNQLVSAYFAPGPVRDSIVMQDPSADHYPVTIHEYVHLVVRHSGLSIPLWLNEGWAEVFSSLRPVKDGVAVGDLIPRHMNALERGQWFSLGDLQAVDTHSPVYSEAGRSGMFYAECWALAHMLYLSPDYKDNFGKFIGALHKGGDVNEAAQAAYGKTANQVFTDLRLYLTRKKLFGTVFLTPFEKSGEAPQVSEVSPYETDLMLADLYAASNHPAEARQAYQRLQEQDAKRPEAFAGAGYLAIQLKNGETARQEFEKALAAGTTDAQLCVQLATLEYEAKQPASTSMAALERAVKIRPDFTEAVFKLGMMKVDARDFDAAAALLGRVSTVSPDRMAVFHTALAYAHLQKGSLDAARTSVAAARKAAASPAETQTADRLLQLIEARSQGPAMAHPGDKLVRAEGTTIGLRCDQPVSKLGLTLAGRQVLLDLPEAAAVEVVRTGTAQINLKCGPLDPQRVMVEYSEYTSAGAQGSVGIVRRLEF